MEIKYYILCLLAFTAMCCTKDFILPNDAERDIQTRAGEMEGEVFYYYGYENKKIFLNYAKDQILVKFTPAANKEHLNSVVNSNASLRPDIPNPEEYFVDGYYFNTVVLEGKNISSDVLNSLKAMDGVASATYLLEYKGPVRHYG